MNANTTLQKRSIQQNNHAIVMIENGNYHDAIIALSSALKAYKLILDESDDLMHQQEQIKTSLDQCMAQSRPTGDYCHKHLDEDGQFMYKEAIRIPVNVESHYRAAVMVSSMIIFNLALTHQLAATVSDNRESALRKAAKLYELSFNMQRDEFFYSNTMFTLAIVNNLGLIHHQLDDRETASKYFEHLLSTLMFLIDCGDGHATDFDGFLRNASTVSFQACAAAAA
jgi:tetratricopeptide (TPR) repeat protein